jgi:hypothetical protein
VSATVGGNGINIAGMNVGGSSSRDIQNTAQHEWLTLGVRGVFDP